MNWPDFIDILFAKIQNGKAFGDFLQKIENEQDLTELTALTIRRIFAKQYEIPDNSEFLFKHVTFRDGSTKKDKQAYRESKKNRWVFFHDVFFAPDILIQDINSNSNLLPIEIKLIKGGKQSPSQSIATALGQALIYTTKYPISIVFIGVLRSSQWGRYKFRIDSNEVERKFYNHLNSMNVKVVVREVGLPKIETD